MTEMQKFSMTIMGSVLAGMVFVRALEVYAGVG